MWQGRALGGEGASVPKERGAGLLNVGSAPPQPPRVSISSPTCVAENDLPGRK